MAADLVQHSNIAHTFVHDLESAFWVILWVAFSYMSNSWSTEDCSSFLNETMSPRVYHASGGRSKLFFMQSDDSMSDFRVIKNTVLTDLLANLKRTLAVRHQKHPIKSSSKLDPLAVKAEAEGNTMAKALQHTALIDDKVKEYDELTACLQDHTIILAIIERALESPDWPKDDAADPQDFVASNEVLTSMRSGSKRSRSMAEGNCAFLRPPVAKRSGSS
jgi:hypothetical protein